MNGLLQDSNGNISSKRVFGGVILATGIIMGFWGAIAQNLALVDYSKWLIGFGSGVIGMGVFEKMRV
jgi:hypothetical protein